MAYPEAYDVEGPQQNVREPSILERLEAAENRIEVLQKENATLNDALKIAKQILVDRMSAIDSHIGRTTAGITDSLFPDEPKRGY